MTQLATGANDFFTGPAEISFAIEPLPPLQELASLWMRFDEAGSHSFFLTWTWIGTLLRCLPRPPHTMLLRATRDNQTIGLAVASLKRTKRTGMTVRQAWLNTTGDAAYDCITIEHNGFATSGIRTTDLWAAFFDWFGKGISFGDEFVLSAVDFESSSWGRSEIVAERRETGFRTPLDKFTSLEGFTSSLSRNSRQKLRRSIRAYEREAPLSIEAARDTQTALAFFAEMKAFHVRSWTRRGRSHAFRNPFFETFHRSLIRMGGGKVDLLRVSAGDRAIGYLYNFLHNGIVSSYQSGFDDADRQLRPGYVCHALAIAHYAASGMSYYDFLGGANALKTSFGAERYEMFWYRLHATNVSFQAEDIIRKIRTAVKRSNK